MISTTNSKEKKKSIFKEQEEWEAKERVRRLANGSKQRARRIHMMLVDNAVKMQLGGGRKSLAV
jgi:hypothetical protein